MASSSVDSGWRVNLPGESAQPLRRWDGRGNETRIEYDTLLRSVTIFEQAQGEVEHCVERLRYAGSEAALHNLCGRMTRHDDPAGAVLFHEMSMGGAILQQSRRFLAQGSIADWPLQESGCDALLESGSGAVTHEHFSPLGESVTHTNAKGHRQRFTYTVAGQLQNAWLRLTTQPEQILAAAIGYNAFGQVQMETAGNGVVTKVCYSPIDGRLEHLIAHKTDGTPLQDLTYCYDPVGNILKIRENTQSIRYYRNQRIEPLSNYRYDTLYQLIEATGCESIAVAQRPGLPGMQPTPVDPAQLVNYNQSYTYDSGGNLISLRHVGACTYTREMLVEPHSNRSVLKDVGYFAAAFDANGNQQQLQPGQCLSWDQRNQLREVTPVERVDTVNDVERYIYDGSGQRVRKIRSTEARSVTHQAEVRYLPGLELRTDSATGEVLDVITVMTGRNAVRVLHWEGRRKLKRHLDQFRYSLNDHLGSSIVELDQQARLISQESYYPYGGTAMWAGRNAIEANYKAVRYSGKERDSSGLYYYGYRYYAPWLHRWINPDPAGDIDGLNLYQMVGNSPVCKRDGNGLLGVLDVVIALTVALATAVAFLLKGPTIRRSIESFKFDDSGLNEWEKLKPNQIIFHGVRGEDSDFYRGAASEVIGMRRDILSASLIDVSKVEVRREQGNGYRYTGAYADVGFILQPPVQNIIGTHENDISFPNQLGVVNPAGASRRVVDPRALPESIMMLPIFGYSYRGPHQPHHRISGYHKIVKPEALLERGESIRPTYTDPTVYRNEILILGKSGVRVYDSRPSSAPINVSGILIIPSSADGEPGSRDLERAKKLQSVNTNTPVYMLKNKKLEVYNL